MDGGDTASYDGGNDHAIEEDDGGAATQPHPVMSVPVAVFLAIRRRPRPRVTRPRRRRAVVPGAVGSDHGARRTKEFQQWWEWYLRAKRRAREAELALWYDIGIPPA